MRKFGVFTGALFCCILLAGLYGILHDQVTYSISEEYFTKFKYRQFGFTNEIFGSPRKTVALIGFLASWWTGLLIGLTLGLVSLIFPDHISMKKVLVKSIFIVLLVTVLGGLTGYIRGKYFLVNSGVNWWFPGDLINKNSFIIAGSVHNYSYMGGAVGLLSGIVFIIIKKRRVE